MYSTVYLYDFYQNVSELTLFSYDNVLFQEKKKKSSKHVPLQQWKYRKLKNKNILWLSIVADERKTQVFFSTNTFLLLMQEDN